MTNGDFEIIIEKYYNMLLNIANKYLNDSFESQDVVQESFLKLYRAHKVFKNDEHLKNWLIRVTINNCISVLRHNKYVRLVDNEYINNLPDTSDADKKNEENNEIFDCVQLLNNNYKNIIVLYYYNSYDVKEISSILKISEVNVRKRLERARKKLKSIIIERRKNER